MHEGLIESLIIVSLLAIGSLVASYLLEDTTFLTNRVDEVEARLLFSEFINALAKLGSRYNEISHISSKETSLNVTVVLYSTNNALSICSINNSLVLSFDEYSLSLNSTEIEKILGVYSSNFTIHIKSGCISSSVLDLYLVKNSTGLYLYVSPHNT